MANANSKGVEGWMLVVSRDPRGWVSAARPPGSRPLQARVTRLGCPGLPWAWRVFEVGVIGWVGDRKEASLC